MLRHREGLPLGFLSELFDRNADFVAAEKPKLKRKAVAGENRFAGNLHFFITDEYLTEENPECSLGESRLKIIDDLYVHLSYPSTLPGNMLFFC
jgi:hypothetical protein